MLLLGGTGTVGRIAGVLCAQLGATALLSSHKSAAVAQAAAEQTGQRFGVVLHGVSGHSSAELQAALADAEVVMGVAAAGVQVMSEADRAVAGRLLVAADVNAVPPEGLAGVGVMDNAKPLAGTAGRGHRCAGHRQCQVPGAAPPAGAHAAGPEAGELQLCRCLCRGARGAGRGRLSASLPTGAGPSPGAMSSPAGEGGRLLVLAGLSVRYLAEAAVQAGWQVLALDCFGDLDTRRVSRHWQSIASAEGLAIDPARLRSALAEAAGQPGVAGWLAGAGLEGDAALLDAGGPALPRLGLATGEVLALRDPRRFFAVLDAAGLRHPAFSLRAPLRPEGWWHKRAGGCGGAHIRPASLPGPLAPDSYFQRHQPGDPRSALFLADGRQAMVVALNRQHTRAEPPPEPAATATAAADSPCLWTGVSGPLRAPALQAQVEAALAVLVPAFGLRGLMSLDFIATGGPGPLAGDQPAPVGQPAALPRGLCRWAACRRPGGDPGARRRTHGRPPGRPARPAAR